MYVQEPERDGETRTKRSSREFKKKVQTKDKVKATFQGY